MNLVRKIWSSKKRGVGGGEGKDLTEANPWETISGSKNWEFRKIEGSNTIKIPLYNIIHH